MARRMLTIQGSGTPTAAPFIADANAALAALVDPVILNVQLILTDAVPNYNRTFRLIIEYDDVGGAPMNAPFQVEVIEADSLPSADAAWTALRAANPAWFYSDAYYRYTDNLRSYANRDVLVVFTSTDLPGGTLNWQVNGVQGSLEPLATAWEAAVIANGGTATQTQVQAMSLAATLLDQASLTGRLRRLSFLAGQDLQAAQVPLIQGLGGALDTIFNFVPADLNPLVGLTGDGATKYLDTGLIGVAGPYGLAASLAAPDSQSANTKWVGAQNASNFASMGRQTSSRREAVLGSVASRIIVNEATSAPGFYHLARPNDNLRELYLDGALIGSNVTASAQGAPTDRNFFIFAGSQPAPGFYSAATLSGYSMDDGTITGADALTYANIWAQVQAYLGR